jgi:hypothetical protein
MNSPLARSGLALEKSPSAFASLVSREGKQAFTTSIVERCRKGVITMAQTTYQVILSTDGKHTVIVQSDDPTAIKVAMGWAKSTYDGIVERYGGKAYPKSASAEMNANNGEVPTCGVHGVPMNRVEGRHGSFWSCHEKDSAGSWCSYKPSVSA